MNKKVLSLLLSASLVASLAGCSSGGSSNTGSTATGNEKGADSKEAPYTLTVSWPVFGDAPADLGKIQEKVSEIIQKKINMKVEFKPVAVTAMANTYSLAVSSGEKIDLISMAPTVSMEQYARDKMILPLDDLVNEYGKDIQAGLGDNMKAGLVGGKQYVIPTKEPIVNGKGLLLLDSIVKKYNIDVTKIKTLDDLDPIFERVHAGEPDMTIFFPFGVSAYLTNFSGVPVGLVNNGVDEIKYVNVFGTEEYAKVVKKMREWYQKGYISKDFATIQSSVNQLMDAGKLFCGISNTNDLNITMGDPVPKQQVTLIDPVLVNGGGAYCWAVPVTAQKPEKSIQFLNLVFQDKDLTNLLKYGIEGVHYVKNSDGTIDNSMGVKNYRMDWSIWGNPDNYLIKTSDLAGIGGSLEKYKTALEEWNKKVKISKAFGFKPDVNALKTESAAIGAAFDQYMKLIEGGAVDPDKYIKEMNDKMYDAGLQKIIDETQRQADEWAKTQK